MRQYFTAAEREAVLVAQKPAAHARPAGPEAPALPARTAQMPFWEWMMAEGLTYRQAAERFRVSRQTIYNWKTKGAPEHILRQINGR